MRSRRLRSSIRGDVAVAVRCRDKIGKLNEKLQALGLRAGCAYICYNVDDTPFLAMSPSGGECVEAVLICGNAVPPLLLLLGGKEYLGAQRLRWEHVEALRRAEEEDKKIISQTTRVLITLYDHVLKVFKKEAVTPILLHEGIELPRDVCGGGGE